MQFAGINHLAVLIAAVAGFIFGGVWYGLLADRWLAAAGIDMEKIRAEKRSTAGPYVIAFIALLVMGYVLAGLLGHLGEVTVTNGLVTGLLVWVGFIATSLAVNHSFQGASTEHTLIDAGHWLGVLLVQGLVIGWMGVA